MQDSVLWEAPSIRSSQSPPDSAGSGPVLWSGREAGEAGRGQSCGDDQVSLCWTQLPGAGSHVSGQDQEEEPGLLDYHLLRRPVPGVHDGGQQVPAR